MLYLYGRDLFGRKLGTERAESGLPRFLDNGNEFFVFEPLSSRLLITEIELKPRPLRVFERVGSICKLGDKGGKVDVETEFEVEDGLEPSTSDAIGAISRPDLVLRGPSLSKFCN